MAADGDPAEPRDSAGDVVIADEGRMRWERCPEAAARAPAHLHADIERVIGSTADGTRETLQRVLAKLDIPRDYAAVLGVWPRGDASVEVHLSPGTFWRTVQRVGLAITSTEHPERLFPFRHVFAIDGIECFTFSAEPVLPPGVLTPGYALRLT